MKRFKFELGGSFVFYFGGNLGEAILAFVVHRHKDIGLIESITEAPIQDYELP